MALWPTLLPSPVTRGLVGALCGLWALSASPAAAQVNTASLPTRVVSPDGGARILNQATVTYEDETGRERSVTTNEVALVVQSVYAGRIGMDQTKRAAPLSEARFVHTLTNTGNVAADFCVRSLPPTSNGASISRVRIYLDRNRDSLLDAGDAMVYDSSGSASHGLVSLPRDAQAALILVAEVGAAGSPPSGHALIDLQARIATTSGACTAGLVKGDAVFADDAVQDRIDLAGAAALDLAKASEYQPGGAGVADDRIRYTLTLTNRGSAPAHEALLIEQIDWPMELVTGSLVLTPDLPSTKVLGPRGFTVRLTNPLAVGASVTATFLANPNFLAPPPMEEWLNNFVDPLQYPTSFAYSGTFSPGPRPQPYPPQYNTARVQWRDVAGDANSTQQVYSNKTQDYVASHRALNLIDTGPDGDPAQGHGLDADGVNDVQVVASAGQGSTIRFDLFAWNLSDEAERLQISLAPGSFPPGTAFSLRRADGQTRLTDPDGDGWFDLGVTQPGGADPTARRRVAIIASLPMTPASGGPFAATATLRLAAAPSLTNSATLRLDAILPAQLDLAVNRGAGFQDGGVVNQDPPNLPAVELSGLPGQTLGQAVILANEGRTDEDALLQIWLDEAMTLPLPAEWLAKLTVSETDPTEISHVGAVAPGDEGAFWLHLRVPPGSAPGLTALYVSARGAASGVTDLVRIDVRTGAGSPLRLSPDRSATVNACGVATYVHRLENLGGETLWAQLRLLTPPVFNSVIEWPVGLPGQEPTEFLPMQDLPQLYTLGGANYAVYDAAADAWITRPLYFNGVGVPLHMQLSPGDWTLIRLRVFAPCSAPEGARDVATLVAETVNGAHSSSVRDETTVAKTAFTLEKAGAPSRACTTTPDSPFVTGGVSAPPGACVIWRLTASNLGAEPVCDVRVVDDAPEFTFLQGSPYIVSQPPAGVGSCTVDGAKISCSLGVELDINGDGAQESHCLRPGESAEARFLVKIE